MARPLVLNTAEGSVQLSSKNIPTHLLQQLVSKGQIKVASPVTSSSASVSSSQLMEQLLQSGALRPVQSNQVAGSQQKISLLRNPVDRNPVYRTPLGRPSKRTTRIQLQQPGTQFFSTLRFCGIFSPVQMCGISRYGPTFEYYNVVITCARLQVFRLL